MRKIDFIMGFTLAAVISSLQQPFEVWAQASPAKGQSPVNLQKNVSTDETVKLNDLAGKLRQIHHTVARLKKAAKELQQEFNRTDLKILEYDDYINQYIDDKPVAYDEQLYPYGFQNIGNTSVTGGKPLPPRKSYVDYSAGQLEDLIKMIGQDTSAVLSDFSNIMTESKIANNFADAAAASKDLEKLSAQLVLLTGSTSYNKDEIMSCSSSILSNATKAEQLLKELFKSTHSKFQKN
ncbi:MAG TPA: hypothetical protein EYN91_21915 [Candidatus Melainabacteria bacterium]|nr:hypothetical protein [Candidatus Melainabacteria bacterium]